MFYSNFSVFFVLFFQALGPWSFGPFGIVLIITFLFTYLYLPETHGRSVEEIHRMVGTGDDEVLNSYFLNFILLFIFYLFFFIIFNFFF